MDTLLDHLCRFTVRAPATCSLAAFLGSMPRGVLRSAVASRYSRVSARGRDLPRPPLPTPFNALFRPRAPVSLLRPRLAVAAGAGIFTGFPSASPFGLSLGILRPRLTLIRLALIRNPWSFGGRVSRPPSRYLCLHLLFHPLQHASRHAFHADGMLPYRHPKMARGFGKALHARLLSMPAHSTSELLRTL